jgi:aryl-alcohol dehydrogenase-like predicted oxidoreductase
VGLQIQYSLIERTVERDLLPMAKALDIGVTAWSPLGGGVLTGKYSGRTGRPEGVRFTTGEWADAYLTERNLRIAAEVAAVAKASDRSCAQVALAWMRQQRQRGVIIPIIGARSAAQLQDNLGCLDGELSAEHLARLDEVSRIDLGFPHAFLEWARPIMHGETFPLIDNHRA